MIRFIKVDFEWGLENSRLNSEKSNITLLRIDGSVVITFFFNLRIGVTMLLHVIVNVHSVSGGRFFVDSNAGD